MAKDKIISVELVTEATAELKKQVEKELEIADPAEVSVATLLKESHEST